jgi:hypothetical protein
MAAADVGPAAWAEVYRSPRGAALHLAVRCGWSLEDVQDRTKVEATLARCRTTRDDLLPRHLGLPWYRIIGAQAESGVTAAFSQLVRGGSLRGAALVIVDETSTGLEGRIYARLRRRKFRATTGPDEGIDTRGATWGPYCVYVPREAVDAISLASWQGVLLHEARHLTQLRNNPDLAEDFTAPDGGRSIYAGFCEACADDGLYTTPLYYARERMARLRAVMGPEAEPLIQRACAGYQDAYEALRFRYDQAAEAGAFDRLFVPRY